MTKHTNWNRGPWYTPEAITQQPGIFRKNAGLEKEIADARIVKDARVLLLGESKPATVEKVVAGNIHVIDAAGKRRKVGLGAIEKVLPQKKAE